MSVSKNISLLFSDVVYLMRCIVVSISLAALIISVVRVEIWAKTEGEKIL